MAKVTTQDVPLYLDEIGTTAAYETVDVKPQVTGQIISREFTDGGDVKKGDLLFRIDPRPVRSHSCGPPKPTPRWRRRT